MALPQLIQQLMQMRQSGQIAQPGQNRFPGAMFGESGGMPAQGSDAGGGFWGRIMGGANPQVGGMGGASPFGMDQGGGGLWHMLAQLRRRRQQQQQPMQQSPFQPSPGAGDQPPVQQFPQNPWEMY